MDHYNLSDIEILINVILVKDKIRPATLIEGLNEKQYEAYKKQIIKICPNCTIIREEDMALISLLNYSSIPEGFAEEGRELEGSPLGKALGFPCYKEFEWNMRKHKKVC